MARTLTLADMRERVRQLGSYERSADITDALLNSFINAAIADVWDLFVNSNDDRYLTYVPLSATDESHFALPGNFYKLRKVELTDGSDTYELKRVDLERTHLMRSTVSAGNYRYRETTSELVIHPSPPSPPAAYLDIAIYYWPCAAVLSDDSQTWDGINGFEDLVICHALRKCLVRHKLPTTEVDTDIVRLSARIKSSLDRRGAEPFYLIPQPSIDTDEGGEPWR